MTIDGALVDDDVLENSFAGAVQQQPPNIKISATHREARVVQYTTIELGEKRVVQVVTRCTASDQAVDEAAVVTAVVVGGGRCRR